MMYEVHIQSRGPEGIRGYTTFRTTADKSDELLKRIKAKVPGDQLLAGLQATEDELANEQQPKSESAPSALSQGPNK